MEDDLFDEIDINDLDQGTDDADLLDTLVGPTGRFKSVEELAKAKLKSDQFIEQLKAENAELRGKQSTSQTLESVMAQIKQEFNSNRSDGQNNQNLENHENTIDDSKLKDIVTKLLSETETERTVKANREKVADALKVTWGGDAQILLNQKARELGMSLVDLRGIADRSPSAFYRLVGLDIQREAPVNAPTGTVTVNGNQKNFGVNKPKSFYDKLKATDSKTYFSTSNQRKMYEDAMKLGNAFFTN